MEKTQLMQYIYLQKEIKNLEKKIKKLEGSIVRDRVKGSNTEFPYQEIHIQIEGYENSPYYRRLKRTLNKRYKKCIELEMQIQDFISSIEDSRTRLVFELRYIEGKSWVYISKQLGSSNESYARMIHNRYLNER
ncbi:hypothetical protein [Peptoniphilus catoniae]|uniref:hypothetical protein n=1 Tax=Peptoniphilus catoniae TaxID=1660341 RepID=UPI0010FE4724|nr:hypothetical protein [Peptoniphilus catoniae]